MFNVANIFIQKWLKKNFFIQIPKYKKILLLEKSAHILIKTRIISNLIKHIFPRNEQEYEKFIIAILNSSSEYFSNESLLTYSEEFQIEIQNLKTLADSNQLKNESIKSKLKTLINNEEKLNKPNI